MKLRPLDYHVYLERQRQRLAPRMAQWQAQAYEDTLALLQSQHTDKTQVDCIIALANMAIYAPLTMI